MAKHKKKEAPNAGTLGASMAIHAEPDSKFKNQTQETLAAALSYAKERGWSSFPAPPGDKKSYKAAEHSNGRPWGMTNDPEEIRQDYARWPLAGIGLPTGAVNGFWVTEYDTPKGHGVDGIAERKRLEATYGPLPETYQVISPTGSPHDYWQWPTNGTVIRNSTSKIAPGIDVRGEGGMVLAPPTMRPGVGSYRVSKAVPIAKAPDWLVALAMRDDDGGERVSGDEPEAEPTIVAAAVAVIPNNDYGMRKPDKNKWEFSWEDWNNFGMACWRATGGSEAGFAIFDGWSAKNKKKYNAKETRERWEHYPNSPPTSIGAGTIFYLANEADPDWLRRYDAELMAKMRAANRRSNKDNDQSQTTDTKQASGDDKPAPGDDAKDDAQPPPPNLMLRHAWKVWGPGERVAMGQWQFGANGEVLVDIYRARWSNYATNTAGGLKALERMAGMNEVTTDTNQGGELTSVCAADVAIEDYDWLWPERFALGKIALLVGMPEEGKGLVICDMTARITRGTPWPCNEGTALLGNVVMLSAEDDIHDTLVPRLNAAGTDTKRVHIIKMVQDVDEKTGNPKDRMFSLVTDLHALRHKVSAVGNVKMVVIDPITSYLGVKKIDSYRSTDVRAVLGPLQEFAEHEHLLVLGVMHFNKKQDVIDVLLRISDSLAFGAVARHVYGVIRDAENARKFFVRAKNNIVKFGQKSLTFWFAEREAGVSKRTGKTLIRPHIVWANEPVDISANEALQAASENRASSAVNEAKRFLQTLLANGPVSSSAVYEAARENGIAKNTLRRAAKDKLGVEIRKDGPVVNNERTWQWHLPPQQAESPF